MSYFDGFLSVWCKSKPDSCPVDGVIDTTVSAGSFHIGFLPTGYWPTFYVAKLRRTVNATSTGKAYFGIFHWQPSTVFNQKTGYSR